MSSCASVSPMLSRSTASCFVLGINQKHPWSIFGSLDKLSDVELNPHITANLTFRGLYSPGLQPDWAFKLIPIWAA